MANDIKVSITIEGTDTAGKKTSTKIPYINPTISDDTMKEFAEKCAELSADTYIGTTKTTEEDITNGSGASKPKYELTLNAEDLADIVLGDEASQGELPVLATASTVVPFSTRMQLLSPNNVDATYIGIRLKAYAIAAFNDQNELTFAYNFQQVIGAGAETVIVDFMFDETATTAATTYRLTTKMDKATTFVQV